MTKLQTILFILILNVSVLACVKSEARSQKYVWQNVTAKAEFPQGYNYPVFVLNAGNLLALNVATMFGQ